MAVTRFVTLTKPITLPAAAGYTGAVDLDGLDLCGLLLPASVVSTSLLVYGSESEDGTYTPVYDALGNQYAITVAPSRRVLLDAESFRTFRWLKLYTAGTEGATRACSLICQGAM